MSSFINITKEFAGRVLYKYFAFETYDNNTRSITVSMLVRWSLDTMILPVLVI